VTKRNTKWTPEEDQLLLELKAAGTSLAEIAKRLNRTQAGVDSRTNALKYPPKAKGNENHKHFAAT
jgi:DNA-binding NarL/FixJ family response regulator